MPRNVKIAYPCREQRHDACFSLLHADHRKTSWCRCPCHFEFTISLMSRQAATRALYRRDQGAPAAVVDRSGRGAPLFSPPAAVAVVDAPAPLDLVDELVEPSLEPDLPF